MNTNLFNKYVIVTITLIYTFITICPPALAQDINSSDTQKIIQAFNNAATSGFVNYEQYKKFNAVFNKYSDRDFTKYPLKDDEILELEKLVDELRKTIPEWIERLIQSAKSLESEGLVTFNNPDWNILSKECLNVGSPLESQLPLDEFIDALNKMKNDKEFNWSVFEKNLNRDYGDCTRHMEGIIRQVSIAKAELEKELDKLAKKIQKKEEECRDAKGQLQANCNAELDELYQEFENKEEKIKKLKKFEDEGMKFKALLGLAAIIAGIAIGVYCCPKIGASIASWGGQMYEENQHYEKTEEVIETQVTGRKRILGQSGNATEEEVKSLLDDMKKEGFNKVPVEDKTPGEIAYEVFQAKEELRVYIVKGPKLIAKIESINITIKPNNRNVVRLASINVEKINGDVFVNDNLIKLNVEGAGPDGKQIKVSIVETAVGSNRFTLIVE